MVHGRSSFVFDICLGMFYYFMTGPCTMYYIPGVQIIFFAAFVYMARDGILPAWP